MPDYEKIRNIIRNDAKIQNYYIDEEGATCVLGGLAEAAGFDMHRFFEIDPEGIGTRQRAIWAMFMGTDNDKEEALTQDFLAALRSYGLSNGQLDQLQNINDAYQSGDARHEALLQAIDRFEHDA